MLLGINRSFEGRNQQPIFFVDPSYLDFEAAIDFIINDLQAKVVGLIYRPYKNVPLSYEALFKYVDKDVAFLNTQVYRLDTQNRARALQQVSLHVRYTVLLKVNKVLQLRFLST